MHAKIQGIEYYLPDHTVSTADLAKEFPEWSVEKIDKKTGILERHIAASNQCSSDLAQAAAEKLFAKGLCQREDVDFILFCTQSPDYFLPTTACLLQDRLGLPTSAGALDFNLGCSGYVYGLGLAEGLIATGQAKNILLLMGETYSKFIHPLDKSVRTIFGDAGSATLLTAQETASIGPFLYGTDGRGGDKLIVPSGGMRQRQGTGEEVTDASGNRRTDRHLYMDGAEIFTFTLDAVPAAVNGLLAKSGVSLDQIDLFVFHQANQYMLEHLRKKMGLPEKKFLIAMRHCGNTVSSTIPIALHHAQAEGRLTPGSLVMLVGFGVGLSWGATLVRV
jgi:3-oxoacyl-[acyl-carrier-protein] synthase III